MAGFEGVRAGDLTLPPLIDLCDPPEGLAADR